MQITGTTRLGDVTSHVPASIEVFERYGIDFSCDADLALEEAVAASGLSLGDVLAEIERASEAQAEEDALHRDWARYSPAGLADHIASSHHDSFRERLPELGTDLAVVLLTHGDAHDELFELGRHFERLRAAAEAHFGATESSVFPLLDRVAPPPAVHIEPPVLLDAQTAETLRGGVDRMEREHADLAQHLRAMREVTLSYEPPGDAGESYRDLLGRLRELELELHRHVHLENDILIPAVRELIS